MFKITSFFGSSSTLLVQGAVVTIEIALLSMAIGIAGGLLVGIVNCRKMNLVFLKKLCQSFVWIVRGTPLFVQVLLVYYALPEWLGFSLSPFMAGVIALGINSTAYLSEIVRGGIDAIPDGQWDASYALGLNTYHTLAGVIIPQMVRISLPSVTNELTALIKETSILMVIGVAELTKVSKDIVTRELDPMTIFLAAAALYLLMTSCVAGVTQLIQKRGQP